MRVETRIVSVSDESSQHVFAGTFSINSKDEYTIVRLKEQIDFMTQTLERIYTAAKLLKCCPGDPAYIAGDIENTIINGLLNGERYDWPFERADVALPEEYPEG